MPGRVLTGRLRAPLALHTGTPASVAPAACGVAALPAGRERDRRRLVAQAGPSEAKIGVRSRSRRAFPASAPGSPFVRPVGHCDGPGGPGPLGRAPLRPPEGAPRSAQPDAQAVEQPEFLGLPSRDVQSDRICVEPGDAHGCDAPIPSDTPTQKGIHG